MCVGFMSYDLAGWGFKGLGCRSLGCNCPLVQGLTWSQQGFWKVADGS